MSQNYVKQRMSPRKRFLAVNIIRVAHTGMTNSLVARNVDISEVLTRYLTNKWVKKGVTFPQKVVKVIYIRIADILILSFSGRF